MSVITVYCQFCRREVIDPEEQDQGFHLVCQQEVTSYEPNVIPENIPFQEFIIGKRMREHRPRFPSEQPCLQHDEYNCFWQYFWNFPNGFKVSGFHDGDMGRLLDFYVEFMITTILDDFPKDRTFEHDDELWYVLSKELAISEKEIHRVKDHQEIATFLNIIHDVKW